MKTLIVDDEPLARERLRALLGELDDIEIVGEAGDGASALAAVAELKPELVLLDIRMPGIDGLETARHLASFETPPAVVFCTAYGDHALEAFEASAVDYLLKPVRSERLRAALDKARRWTVADRQAAAPPGQARSHLCARVRGNLLLIPIGDVYYLLAEDKYVIVYHGGGQLLIEEPLKALEEEFGERFVRIHRNCLVARERLTGLRRDAQGHLVAVVAGVDTPLEISRRNLPMLRKLIKTL